MPEYEGNRAVRWLALFLLLGFALSPISADAHGGMQQNTDDAVITLYQEPLSLVIGEHVALSFVFSDKSDNRLRNMPVKLTLIDTYHGNAKKDKTLLTKTYTTDANGIINFNYTFWKPNYYDFDLDFRAANRDQQAGFLVQVSGLSWLAYGLMAGTAALGAGLAVILIRKRTTVSGRRSV